MAFAGGLWIGVEVGLRAACFKKMAIGWRVLSMLGMGWGLGKVFAHFNAQYYGPTISAYFRKYSHVAKNNIHDI